MIYFDVTKTGASAHRSGLTRVSGRLREALGAAAVEVVFQNNSLLAAAHPPTPISPRPDDWFFTSELFSEAERPGLTAFLAAPPCRTAALFHDAIPLKHPHITWPQSVARHPGYMKLLASFNRVLAVSQASRAELLDFWQWQGIEQPPPVDVLPLGADFNSQPRVTSSGSQPSALSSQLLCLGILEPRKNQSFLLDVCTDLWRTGLAFELHLVGRVNPHFGPPIVAKIKSLRRAHGSRLHFHEAAPDTTVAQLYAHARATVFPTIAEGCGLPLLESLWMGVPCVHSDLPPLNENAAGGGCLAAPVNDHAAWTRALTTLLTEESTHARLVHEAISRPVPTWSAAAHTLATLLAA